MVMQMPAENELQQLSKFIRKELVQLKENVLGNYAENMKKRTQNPFLSFENRDILKYMALGRSLDSQLGNRMQRIIFYLARKRYGVHATPNLIYINISDAVKREITCTLYSVPFDIPRDCQGKGFAPYKQTVYIGKTADQRSAKRTLKVKADADDLLMTQGVFSHIPPQTFSFISERIGKVIPVDLLYFDCDTGPIDGAHTFEIKMGGDLDTKNAESNAREVGNLQTLFRFLPQNFSFFATCYGTCSHAVSQRVEELVGQGGVLNGEAFWSHILPEGENAITYAQFIDTFQQAFCEAGIEQELQEL